MYFGAEVIGRRRDVGETKAERSLHPFICDERADTEDTGGERIRRDRDKINLPLDGHPFPSSTDRKSVV